MSWFPAHACTRTGACAPGSLYTSAGLSNGSEEVFDGANQTAYDSIQALRTVQSYNLQARVVAAYNRLLVKPCRRSLYHAISSGVALGVGQGTMLWVYALSFWYGGKLVERGEMDLESTLKVFLSFLLATMGISQAQIAFPDISKGARAVARVFRGACLGCIDYAAPAKALLAYI